MALVLSKLFSNSLHSSQCSVCCSRLSDEIASSSPSKCACTLTDSAHRMGFPLCVNPLRLDRRSGACEPRHNCANRCTDHARDFAIAHIFNIPQDEYFPMVLR